MMYPPSLPQAVLSRSFRAGNGELGLLLKDAPAFLDACQADAVNVLGWELWLVNHDWNTALNEPGAAPGYWCGLIPTLDHPLPGVFHGSGDLNATRKELASLDVQVIDPRWSEYVRVNITLD